jgi:hypothetical protein
MKSLLKEYVKAVIKEVYNTKDIDNLSKTLDTIVSKYSHKYMAKSGEKLYDIATREVVAKLLQMGYTSLPDKEDEGATRDVYHRPQDPYVVKINKGSTGMSFLKRTPANKSEIDIGTGMHGLDALNIVPKIINYDRFYSEDPVWIIAERVTTLKLANESVLQYIFPTFFNTFKINVKDNIVFVLQNIFSQTDGSTPDELPIYQMRLQDFVDIYCDLVSFQYPEDEIDLNYIDQLRQGTVKPRDLQKLLVCMKYVQTSDLHEGNIGIRISSNPTPDDIVILDFDANY